MLLYIAGGAGFLLALIAIVLVTVFCIKSKSPIIPIILFVFGFLLFMGSGFMHWNGAREPAEDSQRQEHPQESDIDSKDDNEENPSGQRSESELTTQADYSGSLGDYYVEIKDAVLANDSDGNSAIVITYSWTNNSNDTTSAEVALMEKAFQNGIQLDTVYNVDKSIYNSDLSFKDLRPGASLDVQCAFSIPDLESDVEFELSELISFSDETVIKDFNLSDIS